MTSISSFVLPKWHETKLQSLHFNYKINWKAILRVLSKNFKNLYKTLSKWVIFFKLVAYDQNFSMCDEDKLWLLWVEVQKMIQNKLVDEVFEYEMHMSELH